MKLYALLIGIDAYQRSPLRQCVNDANKFEAYLKTLKNSFDAIAIKKLTDHNGTKENIIHQIGTFLTTATDDDVAVLYYSGHGAQEDAAGRFSEAYTGLLECLVCYDGQENSKTNFLLANKELRYLFAKFKNNPHLVTIFDCCHSGEIVRAANNDSENDSRIRRISGAFPARNYSDFIFAKDVTEEELKSKKVASLIPYKNSINISACLSSEYSWEDSKGGVFTRYLLQLLHAKNDKINYKNITKWAKISLKEITQKKQTPILTVQGQGKLNHNSSWLGLYTNELETDQGAIVFNTKNGWYYNKGQLFGIKTGTPITVKIDKDKTITAKVTQVNLEDALISVSKEQQIVLDDRQSYPVVTTTIYNPLNLYINNPDYDQNAENQLRSILENIPSIIISNAETASFFVTIFNQTVSISLPWDTYRPLTLQIDLLESSDDELITIICNQLSALVKWNYYNTLENPDAGFGSTPIQVDFRIDEEQLWEDVTNCESVLSCAEGQKTIGNEPFQQYQIKITNTSDQKIYVTALLLSSDMSISSDPLDNLFKALEPNESVFFYEHYQAAYAGWAFDTYKEIYNWKQDWLHYKFIVNTGEDLTNSIPDMLLDPLAHPIIHSGGLKGHGPIAKFLPKKDTWDVYSTTLKLNNPTYNIIGKKLLSNWNWYADHDIVAPFINKLYSEQKLTGLAIHTKNKPNVTGDSEINEKNLMKVKIKLGNYLEDKLRYRRFKKSKKLFPKLPIIVAEGDSWFLFPFLVKDTLDYVMERYPLRSLAAAGDELQNYKKSGQLLREIEKEHPKYVLISGGGNDIIGPSIVDVLKENIPPGLEPEAYLNVTYQQKMEELRNTYTYFFNRISAFDSVKQVFVHGYDYVLADHDSKLIKNGWVNKYLIQKGITELDDRTRVIRYLIDGFNVILKGVASQHDIATYLDLRNVVEKNEWYDEIHPSDQGFSKVGNRFLTAINQFEFVPHENL